MEITYVIKTKIKSQIHNLELLDNIVQHIKIIQLNITFLIFKWSKVPTVALWVKDLIFSLWGCRFDPWPHSILKDLAVWQALASITDVAQIQCCCGCGIGLQLQLRFDPLPWNFHSATYEAIKRNKFFKLKN